MNGLHPIVLRGTTLLKNGLSLETEKADLFKLTMNTSPPIKEKRFTPLLSSIIAGGKSLYTRTINERN